MPFFFFHILISCGGIENDGKSLLLQFIIQNPTSQLKINKMSMKMDCGSEKRKKKLGFNKKTFHKTLIQKKSLKANWSEAIIENHENLKEKFSVRKNYCHWEQVIGEKLKWLRLTNQFSWSWNLFESSSIIGEKVSGSCWLCSFRH